MKIYGIDFTSTPSSKKPLTCISCEFDNETLFCREVILLNDFPKFEAALLREGPWVAGIDFPFSLPRKFIQNMDWPLEWRDYVSLVSKLSRAEFKNLLDAYKKPRPSGDKEHRRETDKMFGGVSPQKQYGVPVAQMFHAGAPKLLASEANIAFLRKTPDDRMIFEAYPGALARQIIGRIPYKSDTKSKQTTPQQNARLELFEKLCSEKFSELLTFKIKANKFWADDPSGDKLDALLCAVQAAYAWKHRHSNYGVQKDVDPTEGWIVGLQN